MQIFITIIVIFIIVICLLWVIVPALHGLPPVSTKPERIRRALELANFQPGETFYDLGSGHGHVLVMAAKEFGAKTIGLEVGPIQCAIAWVNAVRNGVSSKVKIETINFYNVDLSQADVVYAYLTSNYSRRLQEKFTKELKKGARVLTISFDLPDWEPVYLDRNNLIFLYVK